MYGLVQADPGKKWPTGFFGLDNVIDTSLASALSSPSVKR